MDVEQRLKQIEEISKNARTTWFSLIAALLFCGVTLLDVQDRDFFEYGAATKLPLIGVEVPVVGFFLSAPVLVLALYLYLHIYLTKLWRALAAPIEVEGDLDEHVYPWLLSDAALRMRPKAPKRDFGWLTGLVSWALGWAFAPFVLAVFWVRSWPYHHEGLTLFLGLLLTISIWMWRRSRLRMRRWVRFNGVSSEGWSSFWRFLTLVPIAALALTIFVLSWETTEGNLHCPLHIVQNQPVKEVEVRPADQKQRLACGLKYNGQKRFEQSAPPLAGWVMALDALRPYSYILETIRKHTGEFSAVLPDQLKSNAPLLYKANLYRLSFVVLPEDWQSRKLAWQTYQRENRVAVISELKRIRSANASPPNFYTEQNIANDAQNYSESELIREKDIIRKLKTEFVKSRLELISRFAKQDWQGVDLRRADLREAVLPGLALRGAKMEGANLTRAQMEEVDLTDAQLGGADLTWAQLDGADLKRAQVKGADFQWAQMERANLSDAQMENADLRRAHMGKADLSSAQMEKAFLLRVNLESADLSGAQMESADLSDAQMRGADLTGAQLKGAELSGALMHDADFSMAQMERAVFREAQMEGAILSLAQMIRADLTGVRSNDMVLQYTSLLGANLSRIEGLTRKQLGVAFGDATTHLPETFAHPAHWAEDEIPSDQAFTRWRSWLADEMNVPAWKMPPDER